MKKFFFGAIVLTFLAACQNPAATTTQTGTAEKSATIKAVEVKTDTTHVRVFSCPMHPEVTGKEGEKCSKCGMALVHND